MAPPPQQNLESQKPAHEEHAGDKVDFAQYIVDPRQPKGDAKSTPAATASASALPPPPENTHRSYLETGVNAVTKNFIGDAGTRDTVNHYASEFLKTAALFTPGKVGVIGTVLISGAAQASPTDSLGLQAEDFALGAAKGGVVRGAFSLVGKNFEFAPTKGIALGMANRGADAVFQRDLFTDPSKVKDRLAKAVVNPEAWALDAVVFGAGEGMFQGANRLTGGALESSKVFGSMSMGASFGMINGGMNEIQRQKAAGEDINVGKIVQHSLLQGGLDALAGGAGAKFGDVVTSIGSNTPRGQMKEFIVTDGKDKLDAFRRNESEDATITVKGKNWWNFNDKTMFIQRLDKNETSLKAAAANADIVVTCHPENLSTADRANHLFPEANGRVWLLAGDGNKIAVSTENVPLTTWRAKGYHDPVRLDFGQTTITLMSPLMIGDASNPNDPKNKAAWDAFDKDLKAAKDLDADAISTDVWWGQIEAKKDQFKFDYYDKVAEHIKAANLKWSPILSLHKAGGNVGDDVTVNLPDYIWKLAQDRAVSNNPDYAKYVSEQGHASNEFVSAWATPLVLDRYANVMNQFQNHFASQAGNIMEINVSLGPSGELRYPSYNSHDTGTGWPTRGALQAYSDPAKESFRDYAIARYGGIEGVGRAWGIKDLTRDNILPPSDPQNFYDTKAYQNTQYGRDLYDWYNQSLINHGRMMLNTAQTVFGSKGSAFYGVEIGAKIPGVHWRIGTADGAGNVTFGDRLAELNAGLIRTSRNDWYSDDAGRGYRPIMQMFKDVQPKQAGTGNRVVPSFTAVEMPDGADGPTVQSLPHSLARWVGIEARRQGLTIRGENALAGNLGDGYHWDIIHGLLDLPNQPGYYSGINFLRMGDVVNNPTARAKVSEIIHAIRSIEPQRKTGT